MCLYVFNIFLGGVFVAKGLVLRESILAYVYGRSRRALLLLLREGFRGRAANVVGGGGDGAT